ncbi:hypothetical protein [Janibacter anophelis]|uniref:hypothetical protein n=1 Tax=Janibacter anophelis TaxID=319054 RepID=UPI000DEF7579|nr:hypothetical protein [Janibacter anophelis]
MTASTQDSTLVLPDLIQGQWTSAVILTYGADLAFFEAQLMGQLGQVPLRVILSDGQQFTKKLNEAASTGQRLRGLNRSYLGAPIRHMQAAHAKLILLLSHQEGLMIAGSGNLGYDGYASPGESWHVFRYRDDRPDHREEFATARSLLAGLAQRGLLDPPVVELVRTVWDHAPWLPERPSANAALRHNLDEPLIDQIGSAIDWPVRELTVHAPFHDPTCAALDELIQRFSPQQVTVLVGSDTSIDPHHLTAVLDRANHSEVQFVKVATEPATYIHAKWIHLKGAEREALVTGSANLSRSALLRTAADGNVELGIIATGPLGAFNTFYQHLHVTDVDDINELGLQYKASDDDDVEPTQPHVAWSRLDGNQLMLVFDRPVDEPVTLAIEVATGGELTWTSISVDDATVVLELDAESALAIAEGGNLTIRLGDSDSVPSHSWPYQVSTLRGRLDKAGRREHLHRIGHLPEKDAELIALLQELEGALIFDAASAWRVAKAEREPPPTPESGGDHIGWDDLDWSRIRRDPRYTGYLTHGRPSDATPTDIQVMLAAISGRLGDLGLEPHPETSDQDDESELARTGDTEVTPDEDAENEHDDELTRRSLSISTRTRMAFNRFITRYVTAARDGDFLDELGPIVTTKNAAIFSHLIKQLIDREAADPDRAVRAQTVIWGLLWGTQTEPGLMTDLDREERQLVDVILARAGLRESALRAIAKTVELNLSPETRDVVRDQLRHLAVDENFELNPKLAAQAAPTTQLVVDELHLLMDLALRSTQTELDDFVLQPFGLNHRAAEWRQDEVRRSGTRRSAPYRAEILTVHDPIPGLNHEQVAEALERLWVASVQGDNYTDYVRIRFAGNERAMAYWDSVTQEGVTLINGEIRDITDFDPPWPQWWLHLEHVLALLDTTSATGAA